MLVASVALAGGVWTAVRTGRVQPAGPTPGGYQPAVLPAPKPLGPFSLVDQDGHPFGRERLQGRWSFLFLGYTHCPDICPMTMATLRQVREQLAREPRAADGVQFVFVSVDPQRDTPEQLRGYVAHYGEGFLGVTGGDDQLQALARQLGALYMRAPEAAGGAYAVDHTSTIFLVDPGAGLHALFSAPHEAGVIARAFLELQRKAP